MISGLFWFFVSRVTNLLSYLVATVLWCSFFFSLAYAFGWVQRFLWFLLEYTATDLWNGTPVTIGSLEIDLIRGRLWATNVIIHTPKRDEWQWESPLICRIGRVYIEHNWVSSFLMMLLKMACGQGQQHIIELYSIEASDIQGFIERKAHVFNFYLMDPWMELPDPKEILELEKQKLAAGRTRQSPHQVPEQVNSSGNLASADETRSNPTNNNDNHQAEASVDLDITQDHVEAAFPSENSANHHILEEDKYPEQEDECDNEEDDVMAHRQAQQLVDDVFSAVKSIGRARRKKGGGLEKGSIAAQIASRLRRFKDTKNKSEVMQEGVKVIRKVGQAVAKKTKDMKTVMPKVPNRREPDIAPVYARVGRIVLQDARVFTRAAVASPDNSSTASTAATTVSTALSTSEKSKPPRSGQQGKGEKSGSSTISSHGLGSKWNKPIGCDMVLRSSELCPPNSLLDENGLPAIYQPIDKIVDVVMKRALVGLAKSNTSRFLQTALGELLDIEISTIFGDKGKGGNPSVPHAGGRPYHRSGTAMSEPKGIIA